MHQRGFTLIEVLVSLCVLCAAGLGGVQMLVIALQANATARAQTLTVSLAAARLEQLRGLTFDYDAAGQRVTDTAADLSRDPPAGGGTGLTSSGTDSLANNVPGFVDYLDAQGRWVGNGITPPPTAVFVRRWSIDPSGPASDLLILQVLVRPLAAAGASGTVVRGARAEARFVTAVARIGR